MVGVASSLLPPNAQPFLQALSEALAEPAGLPIEGFDQLWDPAAAPEAVLPFLARAVGVVLWRADWPASKKRQVIAETIALKRRRGAHETFARYLRIVDSELVGLRAPPQTLFPRLGRSPAERQAWLAQFPELRIYRFRERHRPYGVLTPGRPWAGKGRSARASVARRYAGMRGVVAADGAETPVTTRVLEGGRTIQASLTSQGQRLVTGRPIGRGCARASTARERVFTYRTAIAGGPSVLPPGGAATDFVPQRISDPIIRSGVVIAGGSIGGRRRFLRATSAGGRMYDALRIRDPLRASSGQALPYGGWFTGVGRLGQDRFTVHLDVDISRRVPGRRPFPFSPTGPLRSHDGRRLADATAAAAAAKLGRDQVLIRTNLYRTINPSDWVPLDGSYRPGQIVRSL